MAAPELSVCIPTHDGRGSTLRATLQSILGQLDALPPGTVEVCVSDGGSQDGTAELVSELQGIRSGWLHYRRADADHGFAHHLIDALAMARGTYCWIFSSDDAIAPGGLARVRAALATDPDLIALTCAVEMYDSALAHPVGDDRPFFFPSDPGRTHRYVDGATIAAELGVIFAYLAAHVVRRDAWLRGLAELEMRGGARSRYFPHMEVFRCMIEAGGAWGWLPDRVIHNRGGNDSWTPRVFGADGSRYWSAILGDLSRLYRDLAGPRRDVRRELLCTWTRTVATPEVLSSFKRAPGADFRRDFAMLLGFTRALWLCPAFWRHSLPTLLVPHAIVEARQARAHTHGS